MEELNIVFLDQKCRKKREEKALSKAKNTNKVHGSSSPALPASHVELKEYLDEFWPKIE